MELMFNKNMKVYSGILDAINAYGHEYSYQFIDNSEYLKLIQNNLREANKVYIQEILFRCHMAAITTLFRNEKWMQGVKSAITTKNFFAFCASLRGLVESAADSKYCLIHVPGTLRDHFANFSSALQGTLGSGIIICDELENILIHYSHGKKQPKNSTMPKSHYAKHAQDYLQVLDDPESTDVRDLYSELCEVTHPAEKTVSIFVVRETESSQEYMINKYLDDYLINDLLNRHNKSFINIFQMSFNAALLSLYALNFFKDNRFYTPGMANVNMSKVPAFRELEASMNPSS